MPKVENRSYEKRNATYLCLLPIHSKVELILIPVRRLLPEAVEAILLRVVVPCTEYIVFMFL